MKSCPYHQKTNEIQTTMRLLPLNLLFCKLPELHPSGQQSKPPPCGKNQTECKEYCWDHWGDARDHPGQAGRGVLKKEGLGGRAKSDELTRNTGKGGEFLVRREHRQCEFAMVSLIVQIPKGTSRRNGGPRAMDKAANFRWGNRGVSLCAYPLWLKKRDKAGTRAFRRMTGGKIQKLEKEELVVIFICKVRKVVKGG